MTFITAEIGINHNGDLHLAKKLIKSAKDAGCNAVKFQKRTVDKVYSQELLDSPRDSPWGNTQRDQKNGLEFTLKQYSLIDQYCKKLKKEFTREKGHWKDAFQKQKKAAIAQFDLKSYFRSVSATVSCIAL